MAVQSAKSVTQPPQPLESGLRRLLAAATRLLTQPDLESLFPSIIAIAAELIHADAYGLSDGS